MGPALDRRVGVLEHTALLYAGEDGFLEGVLPFVQDGIRAGEPVLAAVSARKIALLRAGLDGAAEHVRFADMGDVGANPARMIPVWAEFVSGHCGAGRAARGISEPIWAGRGADEMVECQRHESLLNLAFADGPAWQLLCPYDTATLGEAVIEEALSSHPHVLQGGIRRRSDRYRSPDPLAPFEAPLPEPPPSAHELSFDLGSLGEGRRLVYRRSADADLRPPRRDDLVLAVNEILSNSVRHGGGSGLLTIWQEDGRLVCEVRDRGRISDPLAGRRRPATDQTGGRGLWMANQLCDLVQIRSLPDGNVVRLTMRRR